MLRFTAPLWRYPGPGGWVFVTLPEGAPLPSAGPFGRIPVRAVVDGRAWSTSVWRGKEGRILLAVPARARGGKGPGDDVAVEISADPTPR